MITNGQVFVYNDRGQPAGGGLNIPELEEVGSDQWTDWTWTRMVIEGSTAAKSSTTSVDMAHFLRAPAPLDYFKNVFEARPRRSTRTATAAPTSAIMSSYGDSRLRVRSPRTTARRTCLQPDGPVLRRLRGRNDPDQLATTDRREQLRPHVRRHGEDPQGLTAEQGQKMALEDQRRHEVGFRRTSRSEAQDSSTTRCSSRRTVPSTSCDGGTSSSTSTLTTSPRRWSSASSTRDRHDQSRGELEHRGCRRTLKRQQEEAAAEEGRQDRRGGRGLMTRWRRPGERPTTTTTQRAGRD